MSDSLQPNRLLCPPLSPRICSNSCPLSQGCYLTISSSAALFSFCLQSWGVDIQPYNLLLDHIQFTLVHGPYIPGSYATLFFTSSDFTSPPDISTGECCSRFDPAASFFLELFVIALHSSPVAYWTPSGLERLIFQCPIFLRLHTVHGVLQERTPKIFFKNENHS